MQPHDAHTLPRVVIAERHAASRHALEQLVSISHSGDVVGAAADMRTAGQLARRASPDVLIVDADMLADERRDLGPLPAAMAIVAVGLERHPGAAALAARHGAGAYVVIDDAHMTLADALARVATPSAERDRWPRVSPGPLL
jgi:DNA-binding NarL/FixJ family response regulator